MSARQGRNGVYQPARGTARQRGPGRGDAHLHTNTPLMGAYLPLYPVVHTPIMGVMDKRKPHYVLADIKAAFADSATLNRSFVSKQGADALRMDDVAVVATMQALTAADFDKSMTSYADHRVWQDVYRPKTAGTELYVKVTLDTQQALFLISFKEV